MRRNMKFAAAAAMSLALVACGRSEEQADNLTTVNEVGSVDPMAGNAGDMNMMADNGTTMAAMAPQEFVTQAAASDMFEIETSRLAAEKAQDAKVKQFAQMMVADHTKTTNELKTIAASLQPAVTVQPTLPPDMQSKLDALKSAEGAEFDRLYVSQQIPAHQQALTLHQSYGQNGQEQQLKTFASKTAEAVQRHLTEVQQIAPK
jgi:putative membrane protein